jgi:hypothetical protein
MSCALQVCFNTVVPSDGSNIKPAPHEVLCHMADAIALVA